MFTVKFTIKFTIFKILMRFFKKVHFFCIFLIENLHISKIYCNFAPSFERDTKTTPNY